MFTFKNEYYLIIDDVKTLNLNLIKSKNKYIIIYRNFSDNENFNSLINFRKICKSKNIKFYISNNIKLLVKLKADGIYISAHNKDLSLNRFGKTNYGIIGSAHNINDINLKIKQGCKKILFSRLFKTNYKEKKNFLGLVKFNLFTDLIKKELIPLGGIRLNNLNKMNLVSCKSFAILSEIKKKPAKIISRLF